VVNSVPGEFETGFSNDGQTKEHAVLLRSLGVEQLVVAVNKLDQVNWSQERFQTIVTQLSPFLKQLGFKGSFIVLLHTNREIPSIFISIPRFLMFLVLFYQIEQ
jgi:elongation factor 1 alpha-like protein